MKKILCAFLSIWVLCFLCACRDGDVIAAASPAPETDPAPTTLPLLTEEASPLEAFSYLALQYTDFLFCSGAGAWGTTLHIEADGSFSGTYQDSEMGDNAESYPHGTVYYCAFTGQLGDPIKVNDYTYTLPIQVLQYSHAPDTQELKKQQRWCYTTAFGLEGTQALTLYLPGAPLEALPPEYCQWVGGLYSTEETELPFYGVYNEPEQFGFSSSNRIQSIRASVMVAEEAAANVDAQLDEYATQADMNAAAQQHYLIWDGVLNELWAVLKQVLAEDAMQQLTEEQLSWIQEKEAAAQSAAAEFQGGSLAPMAYSSTAANMTKERVYYLLGYLP